MRYKFVCLAAVAFAIGLPQVSIYGQAKSGQANSIKATSDTLSASEQDVLNEINQVRQNPSEYIPYLEALKPLFKGKKYTPQGGFSQMTNEGWDAVEDAIRFLRATKPQPALTISRGLCLAAMAHVRDQSSTGATGHKGANNGFIEERLKPYGTWQGGVGENLSYGNESGRERVLTWLIDDGVSSRGHRVRLLSPDYKLAGLSCGPHPQYGAMCVITLAQQFIELKNQMAATAETKPATSTQSNTAAASQTQPKTNNQTTAAPASQSKQKPKTKRTGRRL
jgi:uncharacterized protein YkwD